MRLLLHSLLIVFYEAFHDLTTLNGRTSGMWLQPNPTIMCLVKSLFGIKTMNTLESANTVFVVHLLFMVYNDVTYFR